MTVCRSRSLLLLSIAWLRWSAAPRHPRLVFHSAEQDGPRTLGVQIWLYHRGSSFSLLHAGPKCRSLIMGPRSHLPTSWASPFLPTCTSGGRGFLLPPGRCRTKPSCSEGQLSDRGLRATGGTDVGERSCCCQVGARRENRHTQPSARHCLPHLDLSFWRISCWGRERGRRRGDLNPRKPFPSTSYFP